MYSYLSVIPGLLIIIIYWCAKIASENSIIPEYIPGVIITLLSILVVVICTMCIVANIVYTVKLKNKFVLKPLTIIKLNTGKNWLIIV